MPNSNRLLRIVALLAVFSLWGWTRETAISPDSPLRRAPTLAEVDPDSLPGIEIVGTPSVRTLLGYTRNILHLHDGQTLAVFSYSGSAPANWMFLIDSRDLSVKRFSIPNDDIASHSASLGSDGNIYIMPYANSRAHIFNVTSETFETIPCELPATDYTWGSTGASNGKVYFGTYPNAYLGEFDITTRTFELIRQVVPGKKYTITFSETPDGKIRFNAWGPGVTWMLFDPVTRELVEEESVKKDEVSPPPAADPRKPPVLPDREQSFARQIETDGRRFAITFPSSRFWEVADDGSPTLRGDPKAPAEPWFLEECGGVLIGISHFGVVFRFDPATNDFSSKQMDNRAPGGNGIMFIEALSADCVIGCNYSQQNLWKIDPNTGEIEESPSMIARISGEPMCAIGHEGKAYLGIYVYSLISLYDPNLPFEFGVNPKELIELGKPYQQTRPRDTATDGKHVFISSDSEYGHLGGALAVIDPASNEIEVHHQLIRDQNLPTLAYDPESKLLWGGTDRWGQMRSHPPSRESSLIYAFDPETEKVIHQLTLWRGADVTNAIGVLPGGILVASASEELALIDTPTGEILFRGKVDFGIPREIRIGADGEAYCLSDGFLCLWESSSNRLIPIVRTQGCGFFTEAGLGNWIFADSTTVYRRTSP